MPTYEYRCDGCDHKFELFQSIKAKPARKCPACGRLKARRLISGGGAILFRGSGFYITDYRSDSYKQAAQSDSQPAGGSTGASSSGPSSAGTTAGASAEKTAKSPGRARSGKAAV